MLASAPSLTLSWFHLSVALGCAVLILLAALVRAVRVSLSARRDGASARLDMTVLREKVQELESQNARPQVDVEDVKRMRGGETLHALPPVYSELLAATTRRQVTELLGRAIERVVDPGQWMVFLADPGRAGEFLMLAGAAREGQVWPEGAVLTEQHGRIGHAIRRATAMDSDDFDAEPPIVKERLRADEPRGFVVDLVVPIVVGPDVAGVLSIGAPGASNDVARAFAECACAMTSAVLARMDARDLAQRLEDSDDLTGLGNRRWFLAQASETLYRNRERGVQMAIAVFGVDHLRRYIAKQKAAAAGRLLRSVAELASGLLGDGALLARWSEDEFVVLLPGRDQSAARDVLDALRRTTTGSAFPGASHQPGGALTVSAGVAVCPWDGVQLDDLLDAAYAALEVARARGGDQVAGTDAQASDSTSFSFDPAPPSDSVLDPPQDRVRLPASYGRFEDLTGTGSRPARPEDLE